MIKTLVYWRQLGLIFEISTLVFILKLYCMTIDNKIKGLEDLNDSA